MPKKHTPNYLHAKPSYVHPSLQSSRSPPPSTSAEPRTVNQRIAQLRREQTPKATSERRDEVTEVVTTRTIPPDLRRILHMAEVDAPLPKPGTRSRRPWRAGGRPPPGPAAPSSWLERSIHAPAHVRNLKRKYGGNESGPSSFCALARANDVEYKRLPSNRSLGHQCLRTLALHWEDLAEYEQHYLPALPIPLKEALLSYLSLYGEHGCVDFESFKILFQNHKDVEDATGSEDIRFLDLTALLNQDFTLKDLQRCMKRSFGRPVAVESQAGPSAGSHKSTAEAVIADSWEEQAEAEVDAVLPVNLSVPLFPNLSRLSLAHAGRWASWADLLHLGPQLNTLTHLSLAYWPRPSLTPNAATTSMVSKHTSVALGGSHFYSDLDDDWHEAANILRRLSLCTYGLRWLDLEGCTWHKALLLGSSSTVASPDVAAAAAAAADGWVGPGEILGPDWNGAWRQVEYINLFQGWIPKEHASLQKMPAGVVQAQLLGWLRENEDREEVKDKLDEGTSQAVSDWVEREKVARGVAKKVQLDRKRGEGKWCIVDHGWGG
ncbi:hypothetical protein BS50DRAFT_248769 [Corynespora cassiicola Philippines]|uniref:Tafazzin n=1 Tax=Corynespora cassiicola Philippines TaxID=1448308 RepID=A0A2T2P3R7_CORCC|nr:hypothetical protein BS50DRAFT_248769 [Corynespora cassiicola Philippines]